MNFFADEHYEHTSNLPDNDAGEFEACTFSRCDFSQADLGGSAFIDCTFEHCDLSIAKLNETSIRDVLFNQCKMLGLKFDTCDKFLFAASFTGCTLNLSYFYQLKLKNHQFKNCALHEVDFTECDLTAASFVNSDLSGALFENSILDKADFASAYNYNIDPENNKIKKAIFSSAGLAGLLRKYDIVIKN